MMNLVGAETSGNVCHVLLCGCTMGRRQMCVCVWLERDRLKDEEEKVNFFKNRRNPSRPLPVHVLPTVVDLYGYYSTQ